MRKLESIVISTNEPTVKSNIAWFNPKTKELKYVGSNGWENLATGGASCNCNIDFITEDDIDFIVYKDLKGVFTSDNPQDWKITIGDKEYISESKAFEFYLEEPLVLNTSLFEDIFDELILPKCTVEENMSGIFSNMSNLKKLNISKVDWSNATNLDDSFANLSEDIEIIGFESLNTTYNVTSLKRSGIWKLDPDCNINCSGISDVGPLNWSANPLFDNLPEAYYGKVNLGNPELQIRGIANSSHMNYRTLIDFTGTNAKPYKLPSMLSNAGNKITTIGLNDIDTSNCVDFSQVFSGGHYQNFNLDQPYSWDTSNGTEFYNMFGNTKSGTIPYMDVSWVDLSKATRIQMIFYGTWATTINMGFKNMGPHIKNVHGIMLDSNITNIELGSNFDISGEEKLGGWADYEYFNTSNLTNVTGVVKLPVLAPKIILTKCSKLTRESILVFINGLPKTTENKTLQLHATAFARLTTEDIAIATNKGWSVIA